MSRKGQASRKAEPPKGAKEKKPVSAAVVKEVVDSAEGRSRVVGSLIENLGEFRAAWDQTCNDPAKSLFLFLVAAHNYVHKDKVKGEAMVTVVYSEKALWTDPNSPTGFKLSVSDRQFMEQLAGMPEVVDSYLGGTPGNGYKATPTRLVMDVVSEGFSDDWGTVTIQSAGKDFATPCNLTKNAKGQWKILQFTPLVTGVRH